MTEINYNHIALVAIILFCIFEIILLLWIYFVRKNFQWLITSEDETPLLSEKGLKKFFVHGYDTELGWIRKPNTNGEDQKDGSKTHWNINSDGVRLNPNFENSTKKISCYGDSFTFCRQVNDNETWEHHLSKLQSTNVLNFGVGNYGIDQSLLRMKREYSKNPTNTVILAVVPDTISRIMSAWKHYYEYGNTFAFKPKFVVTNNNLQLLKNIIDSESKFYSYKKYLKEIKKIDFFYTKKFKKEKLSFPYSLSIFFNFKRNFSILYWVSKIQLRKKFHKNFRDIEWKPMQVIMKINMKWRINLYKNKNACDLFLKILNEFISFSKKEKFKPIFILIPQKDDVIFIKKNYHYYENFLHMVKKELDLELIDLIDNFLKIPNLDELYSDDNEYGGHLTNKGNQLVASIINDSLNN